MYWWASHSYQTGSVSNFLFTFRQNLWTLLGTAILENTRDSFLWGYYSVGCYAQYIPSGALSEIFSSKCLWFVLRLIHCMNPGHLAKTQHFLFAYEYRSYICVNLLAGTITNSVPWLATLLHSIADTEKYLVTKWQPLLCVFEVTVKRIMIKFEGLVDLK